MRKLPIWSKPRSRRSQQMTESKNPQLDKFKDAARELEADEDERRWEERLKRVAKPKPSNSD
jgi:hypothetical protein